MSDVHEMVKERIEQRRQRGIETYHMTVAEAMAQNSIDIWLDELADELADALIYVTIIKQQLEARNDVR